MAQDIMRRILRDYFGYEVNFVMNITDVDDKVTSLVASSDFTHIELLPSCNRSSCELVNLTS